MLHCSQHFAARTDLFGTFDGVTRDAVRCGTVSVPQDRAAPKNSPLMPVILPVVAYANPSAKGTPLVFLAGGPGESAIDAGQKVLLESPLGQMLMRERPIIMFDRRGIATAAGRSSPDLGAVSLTPRYPRSLGVPPLRDSIAASAKRLRAQGVEPRNFTTLAALDDIADVVHALGYKKVVLFGASYGTRDALQFMRRHPDMVESVILDGVAPPNATTLLDSARIATAGLQIIGRIVADCSQDAACAAEYADLPTAVKRLVADSLTRMNRTANFPEAGGWRTLQVQPASVLSVLGLASTSEIVRAEVPRCSTSPRRHAARAVGRCRGRGRRSDAGFRAYGVPMVRHRCSERPSAASQHAGDPRSATRSAPVQRERGHGPRVERHSDAVACRATTHRHRTSSPRRGGARSYTVLSRW